MTFFRNERGQAALTDALYFLLIVSTLSTFLFFFAANYGLVVQQKVVNQYWSEYATGALETILYSSTPRIAGQTLENSEEVDYLLAAVKEDFADDGQLFETKPILAQNIFGIMQPLAGNFDYLFYLYLSDAKDFAYVLLYTKDPVISPTPGGRPSEVVVTPGSAFLYFCEPENLDALELLTESVGSSAQSSARIQLVSLDEAGNASYPVAQANLTMWVPTPLGDPLMDSLNCEVYKVCPADGQCVIPAS